MNTYDDDLHKDVENILQEQQLMLLNQLNAKRCASLNWYFAQGERDRCEEELTEHKGEAAIKTVVKQLAVNYSDYSTNILLAANQASADTQNAAKNSTIAASNVQFAANAILRLAGDVGNACSIINAADRGTDLYNQAIASEKYIDDVAVLAEQISDIAMNMAGKVSEVMAGDVAKLAANVDADIKSFLSIATNQFDTISNVVVNDNSNWAASKVATNIAHGNLLTAAAEYRATETVSLKSINQLNLDLSVNQHGERLGKQFTVTFNNYITPFEIKSLVKSENSDENHLVAIDSFYVMFVKESKVSTFNLNSAEALIAQAKTDCYVKLAYDPTIPHHVLEFLIGVKPDETPPLDNLYNIYDTDGKTIELGLNYSAFVVVTFTPAYKKYLDNFTDFISAPSDTFTLTRRIEAPSLDQKLIDDNRKKKTPQITQTWKLTSASDEEAFATVEFDGPGANEDLKNSVEYRCILLKVKDPEYAGLITETKPGIENRKHEVTQKGVIQMSKLLEGLDIINVNPDEDIEFTSGKIDFIFNTFIASQLAVGNYTKVHEVKHEENRYSITFNNETLDNFGNAINSGAYYIPAIYAVYNGSASKSSMFHGSLSNWYHTEAIMIKY